VGSISPQVAQAVSLRALGGVGYGSLDVVKNGDEDQSDPLKGSTVSVLGEIGFFDSIPGFSLLGGAGLKYAGLSSDKDGLKTTFNPLNAIGEFGAEFSLIPMLRVQGLATYESMISGKIKGEGTTSGQSFSIESKVDSFSKYGLTARALFTVAPFISVGLAPTYTLGKLKVKSSSVDGKEIDNSSSSNDIKMWDAQLVLAITL
jgi:hypothetical protein